MIHRAPEENKIIEFFLKPNSHIKMGRNIDVATTHLSVQKIVYMSSTIFGLARC